MREHHHYALLAVFTIAFLEALVGVGLFVSGVILVAVCSLLYAEGIASLQGMVLSAFLGASLSDHSGYFLGRTLGSRFYQTRFAKKHEIRLQRSKNLVVEYGVAAIFLGRFLTPIRSVMPLLSGVSGMPRTRYSIVDLIACALWSLALGAIVIGIDKIF